MKRLTASLFILITIALNLLSGCDGLDENYSTNPSHQLSFSEDTISFDTIFTTIGSTTKQLMIYNQNDQPLNIESVLLADPTNSGFRINVDGRKGDMFNNVRISAKDSLYVFVEVTVDPNGRNQPLLKNDSIIFTTNGRRQTVVLEAYGQDVNLCKGGLTLTSDTILKAKRPYLIYDSLVIAKGVTVEIEKGALFYMHNKANIINNGTIKAKGTREKPIIFRGDRLDFILNDILPYDRTPSQWGGLFFGPESFENEMDYTIVRNGTTGLTFDQSTADKSKLKIKNSQITNMGESLFVAINCDIEAVNCEFTNASRGVVVLIGGKYSFIHCTLANYMTLIPREQFSQGAYPCLALANNLNKKDYPLIDASFDNCIIDGNSNAGTDKLSGEILLASVTSSAFNYRFNHCVITTNGENNSNFQHVIFTKKGPSYRLNGGEKNKYRFDFRPDSLTTIGVGKADLSVSKKYPTDRYGADRLKNEGPDIGAYEFVPKEKSK